MSYLSQQIKKLCDAGLHLVEIPPINGKPTKAPKKKGWNQPKSKNNQNGYSNNPDDFKGCDGSNLGVIHGASNTVAFDIDNSELTYKLFEDAADIKITDWLNDDSRFEIKSPKPNRDKLLYKLPPEFSSDLKQLKYKNEMIFEFRCGNCQDVICGQHPEGGDYQIIGNPESIPEAPPILLDMLQHWENWKPVFDSALGVTEPPKYKPHKAQQGENMNGWRNPITEFNQSYSCACILMRNDYKRVGKDRFIRPNSESKAPGAVLLNNCKDGIERIYSHGGDALNDGYAHDPFDCMRLLEQGGEW